VRRDGKDVSFETVESGDSRWVWGTLEGFSGEETEVSVRWAG
jgi:hypothetical protein